MRLTGDFDYLVTDLGSQNWFYTEDWFRVQFGYTGNAGRNGLYRRAMNECENLNAKPKKKSVATDREAARARAFAKHLLIDPPAIRKRV